MKKRFIGLAAVYMLIPAVLLAQPAGKKQFQLSLRFTTLRPSSATGTGAGPPRETGSSA